MAQIFLLLNIPFLLPASSIYTTPVQLSGRICYKFAEGPHHWIMKVKADVFNLKLKRSFKKYGSVLLASFTT